MLFEQLCHPFKRPRYHVRVLNTTCSREGKRIDLVKCVINAEIAKQMNEETYLRVILEACGEEGRVDILKSI